MSEGVDASQQPGVDASQQPPRKRMRAANYTADEVNRYLK